MSQQEPDERFAWIDRAGQRVSTLTVQGIVSALMLGGLAYGAYASNQAQVDHEARMAESAKKITTMKADLALLDEKLAVTPTTQDGTDIVSAVQDKAARVATAQNAYREISDAAEVRKIADGVRPLFADGARGGAAPWLSGGRDTNGKALYTWTVAPVYQFSKENVSVLWTATGTDGILYAWTTAQYDPQKKIFIKATTNQSMKAVASTPSEEVSVDSLAADAAEKAAKSKGTKK